MKKFVALVLIIFNWYFAGVYNQLPMMVMVIVELIFLVVMFIMSRYSRKKLNVDFLTKSMAVHKGSELSCRIKTDNKGKIPINRLKIKMQFEYSDNKKTIVKKNFYGSAEQGENDSLEFGFCAPYCGIVNAKISSVRVYDYLAIFSARKRINSEMKISVLPQDRALNIEIPSFGQYEGIPSAEQFIIQNGDDHNEIRQIREYHEGDSNRFVHWNYSARTGMLWIKEYEKETDFRFDLILDTVVPNKATVEEWDAFYELLSAIVLGLLQNNSIVRVHWYNRKQKKFNVIEIENSEQCKKMLSQLYNADIISSNEEISKYAASISKSFMKLKFNLEWSFDEKIICNFSKENLDNEIANKTFVI